MKVVTHNVVCVLYVFYVITFGRGIKIGSIRSSGIKPCSLVEVYRHFEGTYNYLNPNLIEIHSETGDRNTYTPPIMSSLHTPKNARKLSWKGQRGRPQNHLRGPFCSEEVESYLGSSVTVLLLVTGWTSTHGY